MRCFVAIELDPALRSPLVRLLREQLPRTRDVRWCSEHQLHVTLKFLGEVADGQIPKVCEVVAAAAAQLQPFAVRLGGLGCFPSPNNARVCWCGIEDPNAACQRWLGLADPLLAELGFERETRAYHPHITLGRSKARSGSAVIRRVLETVPAPPPNEMTVDNLVLFESRLGPGGARYYPVSTAPLGG
ncbi:MAG TPA: RNA 2',3'-cyclic phosphodiesterase [Phycisphaerae bacterium]|nr:RNA 2',3'-cyclic phosphodiesterase [Phycisphaerae bacterium]